MIIRFDVIGAVCVVGAAIVGGRRQMLLLIRNDCMLVQVMIDR